MATKAQIKYYAKDNGVTMSEAREHFINEAKTKTANQPEGYFASFGGINTEKTITAYLLLAQLIINNDPNADYEGLEFGPHYVAATEIINSQNLKAKHHQFIGAINGVFGDRLVDQYGFTLLYGVQAMVQDLGCDMRSAGVPQLERVAMGIADMLAGKLTMAAQAHAQTVQHLQNLGA